MATTLRDFLEIPYDKLEDMNLATKEARLGRTAAHKMRDRHSKLLSDEKRINPAQHGPDDAGGLVEELERAGAEHGAGRADALEVEGYVEVLGRQQRRARATGGPELELVSLAHATGQVDQLAQRDAERGFVLTRLGDVAREAEDAVALGLLGPHRGEPVAPLAMMLGTDAIDSTLLMTVGLA